MVCYGDAMPSPVVKPLSPSIGATHMVLELSMRQLKETLFLGVVLIGGVAGMVSLLTDIKGGMEQEVADFKAYAELPEVKQEVAKRAKEIIQRLERSPCGTVTVRECLDREIKGRADWEDLGWSWKPRFRSDALILSYILQDSSGTREEYAWLDDSGEYGFQALTTSAVRVMNTEYYSSQ